MSLSAPVVNIWNILANLVVGVILLTYAKHVKISFGCTKMLDTGTVSRPTWLESVIDLFMKLEYYVVMHDVFDGLVANIECFVVYFELHCLVIALLMFDDHRLRFRCCRLLKLASAEFTNYAAHKDIEAVRHQKSYVLVKEVTKEVRVNRVTVEY